MGTVPVALSVFAVDLAFSIIYLFAHAGTDPIGRGDRPCESLTAVFSYYHRIYINPVVGPRWIKGGQAAAQSCHTRQASPSAQSRSVVVSESGYAGRAYTIR